MAEAANLDDTRVHFNAQSEALSMSGFVIGERPSPWLPNDKDEDSPGDRKVAKLFESPQFIMADPPTSSNDKEKRPVEQSDGTIENLVTLFRDFLEASPNKAASNSDNQVRGITVPKRLFGLSMGKGSPREAGSSNKYDYEQKYPQDPFGEEAADNARVWSTYLDEAESFDRERVEGWKETVDVLLVFAGLFSAVITTFVSQASQSLQKDNSQITVSLLSETVQVLRAQFSGLPISDVPNSTMTPTSPFTPSTNAVLVNGLWFTSLTITLSTALFAVLAKQWLYYYMSSISGTANLKARARQLRFKGFETWKVAVIVELLPILLHLAVGMFLTGIIILLFPSDIRIAWTIVAITGITYTLYFISVILPIRYPECPYTTSLTIYVGILFFILRENVRWVSTVTDKGFGAVGGRINFEARRTIHRLVDYTRGLFQHALILISKSTAVIQRNFKRLRPTIFPTEFPKFTKWREENIKRAVENVASLDFEALEWLYMMSPDRSVHRIIARCAAVHPIINKRFGSDIRENLCRVLEVNKMNVVDLRYCLCLNFLTAASDYRRLILSIPNSIRNQLPETEYQSYQRILSHILHRNRVQMFPDVIKDNIKLPVVMWCCLLEEMPQDVAVAVHILSCRRSGLFKWSPDPTRETVHNVGIVPFDSEELGWWKFHYLFRYFEVGTPDFSSKLNSYETCYLLLITIYRNLTSNEPLISDRRQRQTSLENLFRDFEFAIPYFDPHIAPVKQVMGFFKEICRMNAFWSESMTDWARHRVVECSNKMWRPTTVIDFPFNECEDLSLIYHW